MEAYLVDPAHGRFSLEHSDKLREDHAVPELLLHLHDAKGQLFSQTPLDPLLRLAHVTQVFVGLDKVALDVRPETSSESRGG